MQGALRPRWIMAACYSLLACAGFAFYFLSESELEILLGTVGFTLWNGMLLIGGFVSLLGILKGDSWMELIGLPGIITSLFVYAIFLLTRLDEATSVGVIIGFASICAASGFGLIGRTYEVYWLAKVKAKVGRQIQRDKEADE